MIEIPAKIYSLFLQEVRSLFDAKLVEEEVIANTGKVGYWETTSKDKKYILVSLDIGTTELKHFYLRENKISKNPKCIVEESDKVIIAVLNKIGFKVSDELIGKIEHFPERLKQAEEAKFLFEQFKETKIFDSNNAVNADETNCFSSNISSSIAISVKDFFTYLNNENWQDAFELWHPKMKQSLWSGNKNKFESDWNLYISLSCYNTVFTKEIIQQEFIQEGEYAICCCFYKCLVLFKPGENGKESKILSLSEVNTLYTRRLATLMLNGEEDENKKLKELFYSGRINRFTNVPNEILKEAGNPILGEMNCIQEVVLQKYKDKWLITTINPLKSNKVKIKSDANSEYVSAFVKSIAGIDGFSLIE